MIEPPPNSIHPKSRLEWRQWLEQNQGRIEGIWLVSFKKATGKPRMEYDEAVEEAICYGWVDSKPNKLDEERAMLWFAPCKSGTGWSKANKERVEKLIQSSKMAPVGLAKVESARRDGSWNALDLIEELKVPLDLEGAFSAFPNARQNFEAFPRTVKRSILEWIANAKKPETRHARIEETARLAEDNVRANQWRR